MGSRVGTPCEAAGDCDAVAGKLRNDLVRNLTPVCRTFAGPHYRNTPVVYTLELAFPKKHGRRVVNLLQPFGIKIVMPVDGFGQLFKLFIGMD